MQLGDPGFIRVAPLRRRRVLVLLLEELFQVVCDLITGLLLGIVAEFIKCLLVVDVGRFLSRAIFGGVAVERAAEAAGDVHGALLGLGLLTASTSSGVCRTRLCSIQRASLASSIASLFCKGGGKAAVGCICKHLCWPKLTLRRPAIAYQKLSFCLLASILQR